MSDLERWLGANDLYLSTMLDWLYRRLEHLAATHEPARAAPTLPPRQDGYRDPPLPAGDANPLPTPRVDADAGERPPALVMLAQRLGLSEFERHVLLLCAAMEFDTRVGALCARAQADPARNFPTFGLAFALFDQPTWDALSPERPLRYWRLVEINQPGAQPLVASALKADERIVNYAKGLNYLDDRLAPLLTPIVPDDRPLPPSQARLADAILLTLKRGGGNARPPVIQLLGTDGESKRMVAAKALAGVGLTLYGLRAEALPTQNADHETFVRLWQRESALLPIALYVDAAELERGANQHASAIRRLFGATAGVMILDAPESWSDLGRDSISLDVGKPTPAEQRTAWEAAFGEAGGEHPARLAGQFNLGVAAIGRIANHALATSTADPDAFGAALWDACVSHSRPALDRLAEPLEPKANWAQLQLATAEKGLLRQIADQVQARTAIYDDWGFRQRMNRGLGISVLFAGESGTGKTMAAEVIANDLKLALYRIDLSAVVSKFIGETEKNLRKLFDAAEDGGAILFFDEADALFGKRSEVKDSHDRYANIEINYLLQRMEAYRGLAILATNMKSALDAAFLRRLRFIVNFRFPGPAERQAIWEHVFPPQTPLEGVDFQRLAKLNLTGGSIHNIALNAAFLAAQASPRAVTMPILLEAARAEFRKLEKPINEADFRWLEPVGARA